MSMAYADRCLPPDDRRDAPLLARATIDVPAADIAQLRRTLQGAQRALDRLTNALGTGDRAAAESAAWELNEALMTDTRAVSTRVRTAIAGTSKRRRRS